MVSGIRYLIVCIFVCVVCLIRHTTFADKIDDDKNWYLEKQSLNQTAIFDRSKVHVLRLGPGEDLLDSLWRYARVTKLKAATVISVVGSLTHTNIRYANQENGTSLVGHFEIVSVVGNIDFQKEKSEDDEGCGHVHIAISNEQGVTIGGHVLIGNIIYTTAEITILEISNGLFDRVLDDGPAGSRYYELQVKRDGN